MDAMEFVDKELARLTSLHFLRLRMQSLSLTSSINAGSITASVFTVIGACTVKLWDITGCVSRFQLKQAMQNMEAAPFVGSLRGSMIAGHDLGAPQANVRYSRRNQKIAADRPSAHVGLRADCAPPTRAGS
jgi:hypothetical protein